MTSVSRATTKSLQERRKRKSALVKGRGDKAQKIGGRAGSVELAVMQAHLDGLAEEAARAGAIASRLPELTAEVATLREEIALLQAALHVKRREMAALSAAAANSKEQGKRAASESAQARQQLRTSQAAVRTFAEEHERQKALAKEYEKRQSASGAALAQSHKHTTILEADIEIERTRVGTLEERLVQLQREHSLATARHEEQVASLNKQIGVFSAAADKAEREYLRLGDALADREEKLHALTGALAEREHLLMAEREGTVRLLADLDAAQNDLKNANAKLAEYPMQIVGLQSSEAHANSKAKILRKTINALQQREKDQQAVIDRLREEERRHRGALIAATRQAASARNSFAFRFGMALIESFTSLSGFVRLPRRLAVLVRDGIRRKRAKAPSRGSSAGKLTNDPKPLIDALQSGGVNAARDLVEKLTGEDERKKAALLSDLSHLVVPLDSKAATRFAREAYNLDPRPFRAKRLAFVLADAGCIEEPAALLNGLPQEELARLKPSERAGQGKLLGLARLRSGALVIPAKAAPRYVPADSCILYVAASAIPYHVTGYTRRTDALLKEAVKSGWDVHLVTRPGYPQDRPDRLPDEVGQTIKSTGPAALMLEGPSLSRTPYDEWVETAATAIEERARVVGAAVIHAASNWQNGMAALVAARRLGVPFIYEVRGFWDLTHASRTPGWLDSEEHQLYRAMETALVRGADRVVTHSPRIADECVRLGADGARISIVPNASDMTFVSPEHITAFRTELGLNPKGFLIGFAGSLVDYEGVDDLVRALALLADKGVGARAVIAGDGNAREAAARLADELGVAERVTFLGRVSPDVSEKVLAAADVIALPRKSLPVTELVEPLKPVEAMAVGRAIVASDVAPHRDVIRDGGTGLLHRADDFNDLAEKLLLLAGDTNLGQHLVQNARAFIDRERRWDHVAANLMAAWQATQKAPLEDAHSIQPASYLIHAKASAKQAKSGVVALKGSRMFDIEQRRAFSALAAKAFKGGGIGALRGLVNRQAGGCSASFHARCLVLAAAVVRRADAHPEEMILLEEAVVLAPEPATWRPLARAFWARADLARAQALLEKVKRAEGTALSVETERLATAIAQRRVLVEECDSLLALYAKPRAPVFSPISGKAVYFLHFTLPYATNGYATRSHGLLRALKDLGANVAPYSRAGFPRDMAGFKEIDVPDEDIIDGVAYRRVIGGNRVDDAELDYLLHSADAYEKIIRQEQASVVHAASNYTTGSPALFAARRARVPFIYEVRGFWELTRATRVENFEQNPQFALMEKLEMSVAREADRVITLTSGMRDHLIAKGIGQERISVVPNAVDVAQFHALPHDRALAERLRLPDGVTIIGYVGSIVGYEGLDDLVDAAANLRDVGKDFRLLLVGDGAAMPALRDLVRNRDLGDLVIMPGRVPHDEVTAYYSLIDICPFPRKPLPLCEMVSPLKPFEAMAMGKAVLVSSVLALTDIVKHEFNGLVFHKGDVADLTRSLCRLIDDPELRQRLAKAGRAWVETERTWANSAAMMARIYQELATEGAIDHADFDAVAG